MTFTVDSQLASRVVVIHIMLTHTVSNRAFVVVRSLWATSAKIMMVMKTAETRPDTATTALTVV